MSSFRTTVVVMIMTTLITAHANDEAREAKQAQLDAACEAACNERLIPLRQRMVQKCIEKAELDSRQECETYYADYGERAGSRPAMFYDLPECVEAFDYAQSERSGG